MADFGSSMETPIVSVTASSVDTQDSCEDACSICLESFDSEEPATVTRCNHEYHLQCILEWSQRSKECPICWQFLVLKDPGSQELLAAVESERNSRTRKRTNNRSNTSSFRRIPHEDIESDNAVPPFIEGMFDSEFDDHIMQQIAAAAMGRARYLNRRDRQRSSGLGPSQVIVFASPANQFNPQPTYTDSPIEGENLNSLSAESYSPTVTMSSAINEQPPCPFPHWSNTGSSNAGSGPAFPGSGNLSGNSSPGSPQRTQSHELLSFSESLKSRLSAASARYKESFSKSTRGLKEKLLARNNSVKELSKEVQREVSVGIAGVVRMMERLDPKSKRSGVSVPVSSGVGETSDYSYIGKSVQENLNAQSQERDNYGISHVTSSNASLHVSDAGSSIIANMKVSHAQDER